MLISMVATLYSPERVGFAITAPSSWKPLFEPTAPCISTALSEVSTAISHKCAGAFAEGKMAGLDNSADYCPETLGFNDNAIALPKQWRFRTGDKG